MKKIALTLVAASALFASEAAYNYEVTPTVGGTLPEGNLGLNKDQVNFGINIARNLEDMFIDQVQLGIDYSRTVKEKLKETSRDGHVTRYHVDAVKNIFDISKNVGLYGLVGIGYEDYTRNFERNKDEGFGQYGLGLRYQVTDIFALKAEAKDAIGFRHGDHNLLYTLGFAIGLDKKKTMMEVVEVEEETVVVIQDDDKDGIANEIDICPGTLPGVVVDEQGCDKIIILRDIEVNFAFDSYKVSQSYAAEIKKVADFMAKNSSFKVLLSGYTDSTGPVKYNQKLSEKRANAVAEVLEGYGISKEKIATVGHGINNPIATNKTKEGRALNRRVEATFSK